MANLDLITSSTETRKNYEIEVRVLVDHDSSPELDGDWATPAQIEAWEQDEWHYVGVQVRALFYGSELAERSLWAIPYGGEFGCDITATADEIESWDEFSQEINTRVRYLIEELEGVNA